MVDPKKIDAKGHAFVFNRPTVVAEVKDENDIMNLFSLRKKSRGFRL